MEKIGSMEGGCNYLRRLGRSGADIPAEIYETMEFLYHGILKLDLEENVVSVLINTYSPEAGNTYDWEDYLKYYTDKYVIPAERRRVFNYFSSENLRKCILQGKKSFSCNFLVHAANAEEKYITVLAFIPEKESDSRYVYVLVRDTAGDHLLNSIINQYVYDACDYFIYLDAIHNSYTMFNSQTGAGRPARICMDYEKEVMDYAAAYVVEEDRERVIHEMRIPRVLEQLDQHGWHSFSCGIMDPLRGYTRKQLDYRYHDKEHRTVMISRTDITNVYLEEKQKNKELEMALKRAQTDSLTQLLNFRATVDKITEYLSKSEKKYALFFIDIDNFKNINDSFGHPAGDALLCNIGNALADNSGGNDIVGRVGGDEFVFFTELEEKENADVIAEKICKAINKVKIKDENKNNITGSVGIAIAPTDGNDYYSLVEKADKGVYAAKKNGKNGYSF